MRTVLEYVLPSDCLAVLGSALSPTSRRIVEPDRVLCERVLAQVSTKLGAHGEARETARGVRGWMMHKELLL